MMIDFRYHVASLVAVFLALGLGLLIGTVMLGDDVLVKQQAAMISRLEQDFNTVRGEKRTLMERAASLERDLAREREFEVSVLPALIRDRLLGKRIALLVTADVPDAGLGDRVKGALKQAGATVTSTTRIGHPIDLTNLDKREKLVGMLGLDGSQDDRQVIEGACREVAGDIATGANVALPTLAGMKLIQVSGQFDAPVDGVVILSGRGEAPQERAPRVDEVVVKELRDLGAGVVGVEGSAVPYSQVKVLRGQKVATVDNIDTSPGLLSMVVALQGANSAFGVKETAKQFIPDLSLWQR